MKIYLTILFMAIVTYIPRFLPMSFLNIEKAPFWLKKFLYFIPYAALGALIFPGIFTSLQGGIWPSLFAIFLIGVISFFTENIVIVVFLSILIAYVLIKL